MRSLPCRLRFSAQRSPGNFLAVFLIIFSLMSYPSMITAKMVLTQEGGNYRAETAVEKEELVAVQPEKPSLQTSEQFLEPGTPLSKISENEDFDISNERKLKPWFKEISVVDRGSNWARILVKAKNLLATDRAEIMYSAAGKEYSIPLKFSNQSGDFRATIRNLKSKARYLFKIVIYDENQKEVFASPYQKLETLGRISGVVSEGIGMREATIKFRLGKKQENESVELQYRGVGYQSDWQQLSAEQLKQKSGDQFEAVLSGLKPETRYLFKLEAVNQEGQVAETSDIHHFKTREMVTEVHASKVSESTAEISAKIQELKPNQQVIVEYRELLPADDNKKRPSAWERFVMKSVDQPGLYQVRLNHLKEDTTVNYRIQILENEQSLFQTTVQGFKTK